MYIVFELPVETCELGAHIKRIFVFLLLKGLNHPHLQYRRHIFTLVSYGSFRYDAQSIIYKTEKKNTVSLSTKLWFIIEPASMHQPRPLSTDGWNPRLRNNVRNKRHKHEIKACLALPSTRSTCVQPTCKSCVTRTYRVFSLPLHGFSVIWLQVYP